NGYIPQSIQLWSLTVRSDPQSHVISGVRNWAVFNGCMNVEVIQCFFDSVADDIVSRFHTHFPHPNTSGCVGNSQLATAQTLLIVVCRSDSQHCSVSVDGSGVFESRVTG